MKPGRHETRLRVAGWVLVAAGAAGFLTVADDLRHVGEILGVGSLAFIGVVLLIASRRNVVSERLALAWLAAGVGLGAVAGAAADRMLLGVGGGLAVGLILAALRGGDRRESDRAALTAFGTRYAEAWCSQDPESVATFYAESGSLTVNDGAPAAGRRAIAEVARGFMTSFPDMTVTMGEIAPRAEGTVFRWTLAGTNSGPGGTGKRVRISGYEVWQLDAGGLIAHSKGHFDAADYARQVES